MDQKNIEIKLSNGSLIIKGEKKEDNEEKRKGYHLSERHYGSFERVFTLPKDVDAEKIDASFSKGVLSISLPKKPEAMKANKVVPIKATDVQAGGDSWNGVHDLSCPTDEWNRREGFDKVGMFPPSHLIRGVRSNPTSSIWRYCCGGA
jgi:hypothetical protein